MASVQSIDLHLNDRGYILVPLLPNTLQPPPQSTLDTILSGITFLHADCILTDYTLATFLPPLHHSQMIAWWQARYSEVGTGQRAMWVIVAATSSRTTGTSSDPSKASSTYFQDVHFPTISIFGQECEIAALVSLSMPLSQTGPHRAVVQKLFTSPFHRRRGFARLLLSQLEDYAWQQGRWSLMLDTEQGSDAESVYPRLGWRRGMVVEAYGYSPKDGREVNEVWFWKDLRGKRGSDVKESDGGMPRIPVTA